MAWLSGTTLWDGAGWTLLLTGLLLAAWPLFWDRPRGRLRCPRCWYRVEGVPISLLKFHRTQREAMKCPECGEVITDERMLRKTRRRWWALAPAMLLVVLAPQAWEQPSRIQATETWTRFIPTWFASMFLASSDETLRHDARILLTTRRPRCNIFERYWMDQWRDRSVRRLARELLEHRSRVTAGQQFRVWLKGVDSEGYVTPLAILNMPRKTRRLPAVFATPIPTLSVLNTPRISLRSPNEKEQNRILNKEWNADFEPRNDFANITAPRTPGKRTLVIPVRAYHEYGPEDPIEHEVVIEVEVCAPVPSLLTAQADAALEQTLRKKTDAYLNGLNELVVRCFASQDKGAPAVICELLRNGVVVSASRKPMLPYQDRPAVIPVSPEVSAELKGLIQTPSTAEQWQLRIRGTPETTHTYTLEDTYWSGEVVLPLRDVLRGERQ